MVDTNDVIQSVVNILIKEHQSEEELKTIRELTDVLTHLNNEKLENEKKINDLENELKTFECDQWNCDLDLLKIELESWEVTYKEAKETFDKDVKKIDETQQTILDNQKVFCDTVGEFINNYGIHATLNKNFHLTVRGQMAAAMSGTDDIENCTEKTSDKSKLKKMTKFRELEDDISKDQILLEELKTTYADLQKSNECLQKDYNNGAEFLRLRNALKYSRDEAAMFLYEIEKRKHMTNSLGTRENKSRKLVSANKEKFRVATKQRMITEFIASDTPRNVYHLQDSEYRITDDQSSSVNFDEKHCETASIRSYKLIEIMEPSNSQDICEINDNINTYERSEAKEESISSVKNTNKKFASKNDIYKEIYLLKERAKVSRKPKINLCTRDVKKKKAS